MSRELTDVDIERLDEIYDKTEEFVQSLIPNGKTVEVDLDMRDRILTAVWECIKNKGVCTEMEFYPYHEEDEGGSGISGPNGEKYGLKAYGKNAWFKTEKAYRRYLMDWIANTEGAEQSRAVSALSNLEGGIYYTDTDII